jgi:hypothetical protein
MKRGFLVILVTDGFRETEIENLDPAFAGEEDVVGLRSRWTIPAAWAAARPSAI